MDRIGRGDAVATSAQGGEARTSAYGVSQHKKRRCEAADEVNQMGKSSIRASRSINRALLSQWQRGLAMGRVSWRAGAQVMRAAGCGSRAERVCVWVGQ